MKHRKLAGVLALGLSAIAAVGVAVAAPSIAAAPYGGNITFVGGYVGNNPQSEAYAFAANGLLNINPTIRVTCAANEHNAKFGLAATAAPLVTASVPNTGCTYASGQGTNNSKIAEVNVLNGLVKLNAVDSECGVGPGGNAFAGSRIGYLNGAPIGSGYGKLILPDLLTVEYNSSEYNPVTHEIANYAVRITLGKNLTVLGHTYTIGQQIIVGECAVVPHP